MIKIKLFLLLSLIFTSYIFVNAQEEVSTTDINWQEKKHLLTYNLSKPGLIKIRVGVYSGPVYRTIVNLEDRAKGQNQERWNGKDEEGKINFLKYGKAHFCVDAPISPYPDSMLIVKGLNQIYQTNKVRVDVAAGMQPLFAKKGAELRVYIDNKLKKVEKVNSLPFTFNLRMDDILEGKHLLTINLWRSLDFASVAYKSLEVTIPKKKSKNESSGGKVAFSMQDKDGFWQIFTSDLEGKFIKQLTKSPIDKRYPCWSSDGSQIAYVTNQGELWVMDKSGANNRKISLSITCSEPKFSPDGKKIIFTALEDVYHGSTKVWEVDLDTLQLKKLVNRPWLQYNPNYSPDMREVIFTDGPELFGQEIRKLNLKTGDITQITDNGPYDYDMQANFLNNGEEIVYSTNEGKDDYEIYKMDKFGRNKTNLSRSPNSCDIMPQVSKDDKIIYFLSDRKGLSPKGTVPKRYFSIWQMNIDGSNPIQITKNNAGINSFSVYEE